MRALLLLISALTIGCTLPDAAADWLESSRTVQLEEGHSQRRPAPKVATTANPASTRATDESPLHGCGPNDPKSCVAALALAKTRADQQAVRAVALGVCEAQPDASADLANLAKVCLLLASVPGTPASEAKRHLKRACEITDDGDMCWTVALRFMIASDEFYDLEAVPPLIDRGCKLGHRVSCDQLERG